MKRKFMNRTRFIWIWAIVFIGFVGCQSNQSLMLVKNNKSDYQIVISGDSDATIEKAASELQKYLEKMTMVKLPILQSTDTYQVKRKIAVVCVLAPRSAQT